MSNNDATEGWTYEQKVKYWKSRERMGEEIAEAARRELRELNNK